MSAAYVLIASTHGVIGVLALMAFWTAAVVRKGSFLHRRVGRIYLVAMVGIIATAVPMAAFKYAQARYVTATFLLYLAVITATSLWRAWRAIRDKRDIERYIGTIYAGLACLCLISGIAVLVMGIMQRSFLLAGFSAIGIAVGTDMLRIRRNRVRVAGDSRWWLSEHYSAMLGNGVATHIAFLSIGLPRLLPAVDGATLHYVAWFGPVVVALAVKALIDRRGKARAVSTAPSPPRQYAGN
ncbi:MAG: hypothetical protein ABIO63_02785 [Casimicrobiaceae bacterium]